MTRLGSEPLDKIEQELQGLGVPVEHFRLDVEDFNQWTDRLRFPESYLDTYIRYREGETSGALYVLQAAGCW